MNIAVGIDHGSRDKGAAVGSNTGELGGNSKSKIELLLRHHAP